jgi:hypothetical protein
MMDGIRHCRLCRVQVKYFNATFHYNCHIKWVPGHLGTSLSQFAIRGDRLQIRRIAGAVLNKQLLLTGKGQFLSFGELGQA